MTTLSLDLVISDEVIKDFVVLCLHRKQYAASLKTLDQLEKAANMSSLSSSAEFWEINKFVEGFVEGKRVQETIKYMLIIDLQ